MPADNDSRDDSRFDSYDSRYDSAPPPLHRKRGPEIAGVVMACIGGSVNLLTLLIFTGFCFLPSDVWERSAYVIFWALIGGAVFLTGLMCNVLAVVFCARVIGKAAPGQRSVCRNVLIVAVVGQLVVGAVTLAGSVNLSKTNVLGRSPAPAVTPAPPPRT